MPCSDSLAWDRDLRREEAAEMKARLDLATRLLCETCTALERSNQDHMLPAEVASWWIAHKVSDAQRK